MVEKRRDKGDGSIYQRKSDGRWIAKYTPKMGGKAKVLYGKTEQEAKKKLREFKKEAHKGDFVQVQKITVHEYMMDWFTHVKMNELKAKTIDRTEQSLNNQILPYIGDIQLGGLTANDLQAMINALVTKGYAYETIKKAYNNINACLKLGLIKGDITKNPCLGVRLPKNLEKKKQGVKFFTQAEVEIICNECLAQYANGTPIYRLGQSIIVLIYTGMRISELLGLKWKNIDYEKKTAKIDESLIYVKNRDISEGDTTQPKYVLLQQESVKTESSERLVPLNQKAITALQAIQAFNGKHSHVMACTTGSVTSHRNFDRMLRNILTRCGLEPNGAHTLRHTFASMLFKNGVDVKTVSELLGHSDVSVTYNTYIHLIKEQKQQAVDILDTL
ncbi:MAG: site-specific integrase [Defluviitaleaceae bacterium]|nr:site-specific integrase [Defluviitaleaceae bacterium]MCL2275973.1 site-specific integrase [Defluviitaleaceae bacterium]